MIKQTNHATRKFVTPDASSAGAVTCAKFQYTIKDGETVAATDIIELGPLLAGNEIVDAFLVNDALGGTTTANVGLMTGEFGDAVSARTVGAELFSAQSVAAAGFNRLSSATAVNIDPTDNDRSIGLQLSADTTASGSDLLVTLVVQFCPKQD